MAAIIRESVASIAKAATNLAVARINQRAQMTPRRLQRGRIRRSRPPRRPRARPSPKSTSRALPRSTRGAPVNTSTNRRTVAGSRNSITRRESLASISTDAAYAGEFVMAKFKLIPNESGTFCSLSQFAGQYQKFKLNSLKVDWVPVTSTSATGQIALNVVPDLNIRQMYSIAELATSGSGTTNSIWQNATYGMDTGNFAPLPTGGIIGDAPLTPTTDADRFTGYGTLLIGYEGVPKSTQLGTVYITYDITLLDPISRPGVSNHSMALSTTTAFALGDVDFSAWINHSDAPQPFYCDEDTPTILKRRFQCAAFLLFYTQGTAALGDHLVEDGGVVVSAWHQIASSTARLGIYFIPYSNNDLVVHVSTATTAAKFFTSAVYHPFS